MNGVNRWQKRIILKSSKYDILDEMDIGRLTEPILLSNIRIVDFKRRPLLPSSGINVIPLPLGLSR